MILRYTAEQYKTVAGLMTARHNTTEDEAEAQVFDVATSACLEVVQQQQEIVHLYSVLRKTGYALLQESGDSE